MTATRTLLFLPLAGLLAAASLADTPAYRDLNRNGRRL